MTRTTQGILTGILAAAALTLHPGSAAAYWYPIASGNGTWIANNGDEVWVIGTDGAPYKWTAGPFAGWNAGYWQQQPGPGGATQIALALDSISYVNHPWVVRYDHSVWRWDWVNNQWSDTGYYANSISADQDGTGGGSNVWITGAGSGNTPIYQWYYSPWANNGSFNQIGNGGAGGFVTGFTPDASPFAYGTVYPFTLTVTEGVYGWDYSNWVPEGSSFFWLTNQYAVGQGQVWEWNQGSWAPSGTLGDRIGNECPGIVSSVIAQIAYPTSAPSGRGCAWALDSCGHIYCDSACCSI